MVEVLGAVGLDDGIGWDDVLAFAAGAITMLTLFGIVSRWTLWTEVKDFFRWWRKFQQDWDGVPGRPGVDAVPGVMERLNKVDGEFQRNGGKTMKDSQYRTERAVHRIEERLAVDDVWRRQAMAAGEANLETIRDALTSGGLEVAPSTPFPPVPGIIISTQPKED
jgi:hypothetical protein